MPPTTSVVSRHRRHPPCRCISVADLKVWQIAADVAGCALCQQSTVSAPFAKLALVAGARLKKPTEQAVEAVPRTAAQESTVGWFARSSADKHLGETSAGKHLGRRELPRSEDDIFSWLLRKDHSTQPRKPPPAGREPPKVRKKGEGHT